MDDKKTWTRVAIKKQQPWKVHTYSGIEGETSYSHKTSSGALIRDGKAVGGVVYYYRNEEGNVLIDLDEDGKSLI